EPVRFPGVAISQLFRPEIDRFNLKTGGFPRQCALLSRNDSNFFDTLTSDIGHWFGMTHILKRGPLSDGDSHTSVRYFSE
ncbi:MAG: hypothetical protein MSS94_04675, partial [Clostridiales bacterium]|nr:hypothetical protein [Clostridiales bacterium]